MGTISGPGCSRILREGSRARSSGKVQWHSSRGGVKGNKRRKSHLHSVLILATCFFLLPPQAQAGGIEDSWGDDYSTITSDDRLEQCPDAFSCVHGSQCEIRCPPGFWPLGNTACFTLYPGKEGSTKNKCPHGSHMAKIKSNRSPEFHLYARELTKDRLEQFLEEDGQDLEVEIESKKKGQCMVVNWRQNLRKIGLKSCRFNGGTGYVLCEIGQVSGPCGTTMGHQCCYQTKVRQGRWTPNQPLPVIFRQNPPGNYPQAKQRPRKQSDYDGVACETAGYCSLQATQKLSETYTCSDSTGSGGMFRMVQITGNSTSTKAIITGLISEYIYPCRAQDIKDGQGQFGETFKCQLGGCGNRAEEKLHAKALEQAQTILKASKGAGARAMIPIGYHWLFPDYRVTDDYCLFLKCTTEDCNAEKGEYQFVQGTTSEAVGVVLVNVACAEKDQDRKTFKLVPELGTDTKALGNKVKPYGGKTVTSLLGKVDQGSAGTVTNQLPTSQSEQIKPAENTVPSATATNPQSFPQAVLPSSQTGSTTVGNADSNKQLSSVVSPQSNNSPALAAALPAPQAQPALPFSTATTNGPQQQPATTLKTPPTAQTQQQAASQSVQQAIQSKPEEQQKAASGSQPSTSSDHLGSVFGSMDYQGENIGHSEYTGAGYSDQTRMSKKKQKGSKQSKTYEYHSYNDEEYIQDGYKDEPNAYTTTKEADKKIKYKTRQAPARYKCGVRNRGGRVSRAVFKTDEEATVEENIRNKRGYGYGDGYGHDYGGHYYPGSHYPYEGSSHQSHEYDDSTYESSSGSSFELLDPIETFDSEDEYSFEDDNANDESLEDEEEEEDDFPAQPQNPGGGFFLPLPSVQDPPPTDPGSIEEVYPKPTYSPNATYPEPVYYTPPPVYYPPLQEDNYPNQPGYKAKPDKRPRKKKGKKKYQKPPETYLPPEDYKKSTSNDVGYMEYPWHVALVTLEKDNQGYQKTKTEDEYYGMFHCSAVVVWHDSEYLYALTRTKCINSLTTSQRSHIVAISGVLDLVNLDHEFQRPTAFVAHAWHPHPAKAQEDMAVLLLNIPAHKVKFSRLEIAPGYSGNVQVQVQTEEKEKCYDNHEDENDYKRKRQAPSGIRVERARVEVEKKLLSFAVPSPAVCLPPAARRFSPNSLWRKCYIVGWALDTSSRSRGVRQRLRQASVSLIHPQHCSTITGLYGPAGEDGRFYDEYEQNLCTRYVFPRRQHVKGQPSFSYTYDPNDMCINDEAAMLVCQPKIGGMYSEAHSKYDADEEYEYRKRRSPITDYKLGEYGHKDGHRKRRKGSKKRRRRWTKRNTIVFRTGNFRPHHPKADQEVENRRREELIKDVHAELLQKGATLANGNDTAESTTVELNRESRSKDSGMNEPLVRPASASHIGSVVDFGRLWGSPPKPEVKPQPKKMENTNSAKKVESAQTQTAPAREAKSTVETQEREAEIIQGQMHANQMDTRKAQDLEIITHMPITGPQEGTTQGMQMGQHGQAHEEHHAQHPPAHQQYPSHAIDQRKPQPQPRLGGNNQGFELRMGNNLNQGNNAGFQWNGPFMDPNRFQVVWQNPGFRPQQLQPSGLNMIQGQPLVHWGGQPQMARNNAIDQTSTTQQLTTQEKTAYNPAANDDYIPPANDDYIPPADYDYIPPAPEPQPATYPTSIDEPPPIKTYPPAPEVKVKPEAYVPYPETLQPKPLKLKKYRPYTGDGSLDPGSYYVVGIRAGRSQYAIAKDERKDVHRCGDIPFTSVSENMGFVEGVTKIGRQDLYPLSVERAEEELKDWIEVIHS